MFSLFKKKPTQYVINHSEEVKPQPITEAGQLVNYVIGVNNTLIERNQNGWLLIQKQQQSKKGETVLYADYLTLPLLEDNPYFEDRLAPFYKEKPTSFDPSLLEKTLEEVVIESVSEEVPEMPKDLQVLAQKASIPTNEEETHSEETVTPDLVSEYEETIKALQKQLEEKERQLSAQDEEIPSTRERPKELVVIQSEPVKLPQSDVPESLSDVVSSAVHDQLIKLEHEIKMMDTRSQIESDIVEEFQRKKAAAVETKVMELDADKTIQLTKAKEEYEKSLAQIEQTYLSSKKKELSRLTQQFEEACQKKIKQATQQQSEELATYFEQRKRELLGWKQTLNQSMDSQLTQIKNEFKLTGS